MHVAIFSDVHGNLSALEAILADIDRRSEIDQLLFAGDLCLFGPRPMACLELIRRRAIPSLVGNTDQWLVEPPALRDDMDDDQRARIESIRKIATWTRIQLRAENMAWFNNDNMPFDRRLRPTPSAEDDLLVVHANPQDVNQIIFPNEAYQETLYGRIRQPDTELAPMLENVNVAALAFGHLHIPNVRRSGRLLLANISSASLPGDSDPRSKYGILSWDKDGGWSVKHVQVPYSVGPEIEAFRQAQPPGWEKAVALLESQGFVPQVV